MQNLVVIDFKKLEVYEAGAVLLTYLAYPAYPEKGEVHEEQRGSLHTTLCAMALRELYEEETTFFTPQSMKPIYAFRDEKVMCRDLRTFPRRLRDRDAAGRMAIAFLKEAATGAVPELPQGIKRLSLNEISAMVLKDSGQSDPENVESRIWRQSIPVVHLAAAIQVMLQQLDREDGPKIDFKDFLRHRFFLEQVISSAQEYEPLLAKSRLQINPERDLMRFRIIN